MIDDIPKYIGEAKTLYISKSKSIFKTVIRDDIEVPIVNIAVCKYDSGGGFYLFGCDKNFNVHTDYLYENLAEALEDAERLYEIANIKWIPELVQG